MAREYGSSRSIDHGSVQRFFAERGKRLAEVGPLSAVLYQDDNPKLAMERSAYEIAQALPLIGASASGHVLDLGCGTGRWATAFAGTCQSYRGLDMCEPFLEVARKEAARLAQPDRFTFAVWDCALDPLPADCRGAFDLVVIAGLFPYLADDVTETVLSDAAAALHLGGTLYVREPLACGLRLTLADHFSDALKTQYSAIYRPIPEFEALLGEITARHGAHIVHAADCYPETLNNRADTRQRVYLARKDI